MTTQQSNNSSIKYNELLIRIDERLLILNDKLANIEKIISEHSSQSMENKKRIDELENYIFGTNNIDGIYQKVEKHDRLLTKALAYFTILAVIFEFIFKIFINGGIQ